MARPKDWFFKTAKDADVGRTRRGVSADDLRTTCRNCGCDLDFSDSRQMLTKLCDPCDEAQSERIAEQRQDSWFCMRVGGSDE